MPYTTEETRMVTDEINQLCQRLCREGVDIDLINACLLDQAAWGFANGEHAELMPDVLRETAEQMEAGEYTHRTAIERQPPSFTVIEGGGSKV